MALSKALIPAAGRGTRMRPVSLVVPKELLPVGSKPAIHRVVEEAVAAGIERIGVVVGPGKRLIRDYLEGARRRGDLPDVSFEFPVQEEPRGLADAIRAARDFVDGEPFALLLPDNVLLSPEHRLKAMIDLFERSGRDVVGVLELGASASGRFANSGLFEGVQRAPGVFEITRLRDKGSGRLEIAEGTVVRRTCGRYVCRPGLLPRLDRLWPLAEGELDEVPAYQRIAAEGGLLGRVLPPPLFDVGHPSGFLAANAWLHERASAAGRAGDG